MTFYVESETDKTLPFEAEEVAGKVIVEALDLENCPYEVSVNVLLTRISPTSITKARAYTESCRGMFCLGVMFILAVPAISCPSAALSVPDRARHPQSRMKRNTFFMIKMLLFS